MMLRRTLLVLVLIATGLSTARADLVYFSVGNDTIYRFDSAAGPSTAKLFFSTTQASLQGLAFDSQGDLFVAEAAKNTILEMNQGGSIIRTITTGLSFPTGLAVDSSGNLFVANAGNDTIQKYSTLTGQNLGQFANTATVPTRGDPFALAFDRTGHLYVSFSTNTIEVYSSAGQDLGNFIKDPSTLSSGNGIAFDGLGNLYVGNFNATTFASSIETYSATGVHSTTINSPNLLDPYGMLFDSTGNLYVGNNAFNGTSLVRFAPGGGSSILYPEPANVNFFAIAPTTVPEPSSLALLVAGLALASRFRGRRSPHTAPHSADSSGRSDR